MARIKKDTREFSYSTREVKTESGKYDWHVEKLDSGLERVIVASGTEDTRIKAALAARDARRSFEASKFPGSFNEINATHTKPIIDALRTGDKAKAVDLFTKLVESIPGIKSYEVAMLREKVMQEAGITTRRKK